MSKEPMFNIQEPAPMWLAGTFIILHLILWLSPQAISEIIQYWTILVPMDRPDAPVARQITSLLGSGFIHASWTHLLVNVGMIVAFSVITLRGVRALHFDRLRLGKPNRMGANSVFLLIFSLGVIGGSLFQWGWWALIDSIRVSAVGSSGGASALFATAAWAMGGRARLIKFGGGWALINLIFIVAAPIFGPIAWAAHIGGYVVGACLSPYLVKPFSTGFSITR